MRILESFAPTDAMQICRNGHVVADSAYSSPGLSHCDRCGAATLDRCPTCGMKIPSAANDLGLSTVGRGEPPRFCQLCGAAFPWSLRKPTPQATSPLATLETLLRRLPRTIRELRSRHGERSPFVVRDEHDLEDLLRAILPLHFDDIRQESRTPSYSLTTRTDFIIGAKGTAVVAKMATREMNEFHLQEQCHEDVAYYEGPPKKCNRLVVWAYDPLARIFHMDGLNSGDLPTSFVIAT